MRKFFAKKRGMATALAEALGMAQTRAVGVAEFCL